MSIDILLVTEETGIADICTASIVDTILTVWTTDETKLFKSVCFLVYGLSFCFEHFEGPLRITDVYTNEKDCMQWIEAT